jgi:hypothetical protein
MYQHSSVDVYRTLGTGNLSHSASVKVPGSEIKTPLEMKLLQLSG